MNIVYAILWALALGALVFYLRFFRVDGVNKFAALVLFATKLIGGFSLYLIYTFYYPTDTADIYKYFRGGRVLYESLDESPTLFLRLMFNADIDDPEIFAYVDRTNQWTRRYSYGVYNDDRTIIRYNALLCLLSGGNMFVNLVLMSFVAFCGCWALFRALSQLLKTNRYLLLAACLLVPSTLLWASGLNKESLLMPALGLLVYSSLQMCNKFKIKYLLLGIVSAFIVAVSKTYILPNLLPALLFLFISRRMNIKKQIITMLTILVSTVLLVVFGGRAVDIDILTMLSKKQTEFLTFMASCPDAGSAFNISHFDGSLLGLLTILPEILTNMFFRPFITDIKSPLILGCFAEIALLCCIFVIMICFFKRPDNNTSRFAIFTLMFTLCLYTFCGICTPNIGALVRYRMPAMPFLVATMFALIDTQKLHAFVHRSKTAK